MELPSVDWISGKGRGMEEQAKEELQMLEAQYPNHFGYLKLELKSFIFLLQSQHQDSQPLPENNGSSTFLSSIANTQESTSLNQRKRSNYSFELALMEQKIDEGSEQESAKTDVFKHYSGRKNKRRDRVDVVLERAQACLKKIRHFKTSFLSPS